jgi:hypothetical protein
MKRQGANQPQVQSDELLSRGLFAGKRRRFQYKIEWYGGIIDGEVQSGWKILAQNNGDGQWIPIIRRELYEDSIKSEDEWLKVCADTEAKDAASRAAKENERRQSIAYTKRSRESSGNGINSIDREVTSSHCSHA